MSTQAVILAAGEGTRLRPLTQNRPKALIPVANRPILEHLINSLIQAGIRDIIVVVGYRKEQVMRHLGGLPYDIRVVEQKNPLGTAHALLCAKRLITGDFLVLPGDNYIDQDSILEILQVRNSMLITTHDQPSNFGVVTAIDGYIKSIVEKPSHAARMTVSCGMYHLTRDLLDKIVHEAMTEAISEFISEGVRIAAIQAHVWQDAIYPWHLLPMNEYLLESLKPIKSGKISASAIIEGPVSIGPGSEIGPFTIIKGPVIIGENCTIGSHCSIMPGTSIGSHVKIEPFTSLRNSIIMEDTVIASHSSLSGAVIGEGCTLGEHTAVIFGTGILEISEAVVRSSCGVIMGNGVFSSPFVTYENSIIGNDVNVDGRTGLRIRAKIIPDQARVM